jgi:ArsR family transcriptional regulator
VTEDSLSNSRAEEMAGEFKVLADPVRLRLLSIVASASNGEICACDLPTPLGRSQATISHHLSVLTTAGLLVREQRGKWAWFRVAADRAEFVRMVLSGPSVLSSG